MRPPRSSRSAWLGAVLVLVLSAACNTAPDCPVEDAMVCGDGGVQLRPPFDGSAGCTWQRGSIHVPDASSSAVLAPLATLRRIDGGFSLFRNHVAVDLHALECLAVIGGELSIRTTDTQLSVDGLEALQEVGALRIQHTSLRSLAGLASLAVVRGDVTIEGNPELPRSQIDALLARVTVEGQILISDNGL